MQHSRRRFLTGALALAAPALAQDEPEKLPHILDFATEQKRWADLLAAEKAQGELNLQIEKAAWEEGRQFDKQNWEEERRDSLERYRLCTDVERVLLGRFLAPMDEWLNMSLFLKEPEFHKVNPFDDPSFTKEGVLFLLLKIRSADPLKGSDIWIKFSIAKTDLGKKWEETQENESGEKVMKQVDETLTDMLWRKRDQLLEALEHHFVVLLQNEDAEEKAAVMKTMVDGTAHLYRLIGEFSEPDKVTPEQMLR